MIKYFRDPGSGLSHLVGALLSVCALVAMLFIAIERRNVRQIIGFAVFGTSMVLLYSASAAYHITRASQKVIARLRTLDHSMIYVLIAGSYTPVCLMLLKGRFGNILLALAWAMAAAGITTRMLFSNIPRLVYTSMYVVMGSVALVAVPSLSRSLSLNAMLWLTAGGVSYMTGAVIYAIKKPNFIPQWLGFHEIFHIFILIGTATHFVFVLKYC